MGFKKLEYIVAGNLSVNVSDIQNIIHNNNNQQKQIFYHFNPISTGGGGVFHPMPSKWLRTPQRNKLAP